MGTFLVLQVRLNFRPSLVSIFVSRSLISESLYCSLISESFTLFRSLLSESLFPSFSHLWISLPTLSLSFSLISEFLSLISLSLSTLSLSPQNTDNSAHCTALGGVFRGVIRIQAPVCFSRDMRLHPWFCCRRHCMLSSQILHIVLFIYRI